MGNTETGFLVVSIFFCFFCCVLSAVEKVEIGTHEDKVSKLLFFGTCVDRRRVLWLLECLCENFNKFLFILFTLRIKDKMKWKIRKGKEIKN